VERSSEIITQVAPTGVRQFYDDARHLDRAVWVEALSVSTRRPSPASLLVALLFACLAPVGVVVATGLSGMSDDDRVETADGGDGGEGRDGSGGERDDLRASDGAGRAWSRAARGTTSSTVSSSTTTASTATTAPTTTAPAPSAPPSTAPATAPPTTAPPATSPPSLSTIEQVVVLVNEARASAGCGPVRLNAQLTAAAQAHSDDMAANGYFSHTSLDGRTFDERIRAAGYTGGYLGENIAQGQSGAQAVHDAWMSSAGHRRNILDCNFDAIGMGLHAATWTWTQDFGGA
jgi:uncharacterized protein YkwD